MGNRDEFTMINWARVTELYTDFGEDGFAEVVDVFLDEMAEGLERLDQATGPKTLEAEFHFLKGAALNVGFDDISRICAEGERLSEQGLPSDHCKAELLTLLPKTCAAFSEQWESKLKSHC